MRKIFVDLGAYDGDSVRLFLRGGFSDPSPLEYEIYAFEPNPVHHTALDEMAAAVKNIRVIKAAAWTEDGEIEFAIDEHAEPLGSTAMKSKVSIWSQGNIAKVQAIDFGAWLRQFEGAEVIVKMDIEGAEFPILNRLIETGDIRLVKRLYVEFHQNKVQDYTTTDAIALQERLRALTDLHIWH